MLLLKKISKKQFFCIVCIIKLCTHTFFMAIVPGFRGPAILDVPLEGGIIPFPGDFIACCTFTLSLTSANCVCRTNIP